MNFAVPNPPSQNSGNKIQERPSPGIRSGGAAGCFGDASFRPEGSSRFPGPELAARADSVDPTRPALPRFIVAPRTTAGGPATADQISQLALATRLPTLVAHEPARLLAWLGGGRPLRVLCAHDLTRAADEGLRVAKQLADAAPCEVIVAHVHRSIEQLSHPGCANVGAMRQRDLEMRAWFEHRLRARTQDVFGETPAGVRVSHAPCRRDDFILDLMGETNADLVISAVHPRSGEDARQGATTSWTLLNFANTNLAIVPAPALSAARGGNALRRILLVVDLAPVDEHVIAQARALLAPGGTLRLLRVLPSQAMPGRSFDRDPAGPPPAAYRARQAGPRIRSLPELARLAGAPEIVVETESVAGRDRARAIASAAGRFNADLVCLSLAGRPTLFNRLFRWQVRALLALASRPLLIVQANLA